MSSALEKAPLSDRCGAGVVSVDEATSSNLRLPGEETDSKGSSSASSALKALLSALTKF